MGARQDTSSAFPASRTPSGSWFEGFANFGVFARLVAATFPEPPSIALLGGSAGGLGVLMNYPQLKALYPAAPINVISDSGPPFWTGDPGFSPRQGFFLKTFEPAGVPSFEEDMFADAWGLDATHPAGLAPITRAGALRSIYPLQGALLVDAAGTNDQFGVLEGNDDWVVPWYLHLNVNGLSHPDIADGQADLNAHVELPNVHTMWISSTAAPNPNLRPWNQHHGFTLDDVSVWTGSGVLPWLTTAFAL
jgi:hypothetical protein